jgi:PAS domain S-box-containing protein
MPRRSLSRAILLLAALFAASLVATHAAFLLMERDATLRRSETALQALVQVVERYTQRALLTAELILDEAEDRARLEGGTAALGEDMQAALGRLAGRLGDDSLLVVDRAGRVVLQAGPPAGAADVAQAPWFRALQGGAARQLHGLPRGDAGGDAGGEIMLASSRALRDAAGGFAGAVRVATRISFFRQEVGAPGSLVGVGVFDAAGRPLARIGRRPGQPAPDATLAARPMAFPPAAQGLLRSSATHDGQERLIAFRRLPQEGVVVAASVPVAVAMAPVWRSAAWSAAILAVTLLALGVLLRIALRLARDEAEAQAGLAAANARLSAAATGLAARATEREMRFRAIFDGSHQFMGLLDPEGTVLEANEAALAFGGLTREAVLGRKLWEAGWWPTAEARAKLRGAIAAAARGERQRYEAVLLGAGERRAAFDFSLTPIHDEAGRVVLLVPEGHDLTELKAAEEKLRESSKMDTLGQLTGGVAHDFNNLLMVVLGNLGLLRGALPAGDARAQRLLDGALAGAERGAALTQRLLAFARRQELRPAPVDVAQLMRGMLGLLERSVGPGVRLTLEVPPGLPPALADANQLELALLNLALNARDAMPGGGALTLSAGVAMAPGRGGGPVPPPGLAPGVYLRLVVRDGGAGMDAATLARATEPFFTTKGPGRGSGLGLSMVQGLAQQSGGGLVLGSALGQGTEAAIWLPRAVAEPGAASAEGGGPAGLTRTERPMRVLVVDDDAMVVAGTAMLLEDLGHQAVLAASGAEALRLLATDPRIDLVLTDFAMPEMNGLDLAERLRAERPGLPVVLATGYAALPATAGAWLPRLNKPYGQAELAAMVARVTEGLTTV